METTRHPHTIAAAVLEASTEAGTRPWEQHHPVTITEMYDLTGPRQIARYTLAAGHDAQAVAALAASAPHYGRGLPEAIVLEMPGSTMANPNATNPADIHDPEHIQPTRGARVIVVTAHGIGGAIVAELAHGPSDIAHGPHDPDADDPTVELIAAVWLGRQVTDANRARIMDTLAAHGIHTAEDATPDALAAAMAEADRYRPADPRDTWRANYATDMADMIDGTEQ